MKHKLLKCTLCCDKSFDTKLEFAQHLAHVLENLSCPVCDNKWASLSHLIEHLSVDDCQPAYSFDHYEEDKENTPSKDPNLPEPIQVESETEEVELRVADNVENVNNGIIEENDADEIAQITITPAVQTISVTEEIPGGSNTSSLSNSSMYIQIYDKNNETVCMQGQTQKLKLVSEDGHIKQFVIMSTENEVKLESFENAVVPKKNDDGTISLQTVKDIKQENVTETVIAPSENETEDNQDELYSCNTCGVSFSSVFDHIQNYHNDQEVVVEEPFEGDSRFQQDPLASKQEGTKRVITDTGDIVDAAIIEEPTAPKEETVMQVEGVERPNRQQGKHYIQIDKFCDSIVKNINPEDSSGPYHTVMLEEKIANGERIKTYYCMTCNIYASNLEDFKNKPCKIPKFPCPHCPVAYENSKSLYAHMKVHKNKSGGSLSNKTETFECEICNTIFITNKSLKLHKRMHDPVKARPLEPPIETIDGAEGSPGRYQCEICDKIIPNDFKTLHQNSHKDNDQLNCGICNKKFHSNEYLEMHMSVHTSDKVTVNRTDKTLLYNCLYCERRFARPHEKVKHERIHTGEKPHICEICGKSFRVAYCLTLHMRTHTGVRPYACPFCSKRFKAHSVYNHHLLTHSEVRRYKCPFCPKAFKTSVQLAGHKNSHTKPFSCQHCNRPFASLYAVRVHTETHARQNNLKFSCSLCGASYARAFALKDHMKQIHVTNVVSLSNDDDDAAAKGDPETEVEMSTIDDKDLGEEITELEMTTDQL